MANVIKHKRGSGSDPAANNLVLGELAIRTDVGKLFTKMDSGAIAEIAGGGSDIAINTLSSSSATGGGSATFNGSAYRFTLSAPPSVSAAQLLVSINGVIQKPVAGTGQPSEGFSVSGNDIILGDAPATGADFFILTFKSLGVSEPADNSVTSAKIVDGAIVNADINASAAIAGSKISPDFGSQNIATTGTLASSHITIANSSPRINLTDTDQDSDFRILVNDGKLKLQDTTNGNANRLLIASDGTVDITGNLDVGAGIDVTGAITSTGGVQITGGSLDINEKIKHIGDLDTFISFPSNDTIGLTTGNTERMRIDSSGRVLIGTTNTTTVGTVNKNLIVGSTTNAEEVAVTLNVMEGTNNRRVKFFLDDDDGVYGFDTTSSTVTAQFVVRHATSEKMRIDSSGNVGIGTTSMTGKLNVQGSAGGVALETTDATNSTFRISHPSAAVTLLSGGSSQHLALGTGFAEKMRIDSSGRVHIGTATNRLGEALHVLGNGITTSSAENTNMMIFGTFGGSNALIGSFNSIPLIFKTGNTERMRIDSSGDVLIGTTTAITDTKLVVDGNIAQKNSGTGTGSAVKQFVLSRDYSMSTSSTNVLTFDNWGTSAFDITVFRRDTASPHGAQVLKLYIGVQGSGSNMTSASLVQSNKVLRGSIHNVDFAVSDNGNTVTLSVTGDDNGGEAQKLVFYILATGGNDGDVTVI